MRIFCSRSVAFKQAYITQHIAIYIHIYTVLYCTLNTFTTMADVLPPTSAPVAPAPAAAVAAPAPAPAPKAAPVLSAPREKRERKQVGIVLN
jgi:hypothetical protein